MLTMPSVPFSSYEVADILKRTWSTNATEQQAPLISRLSNSIIKAQDYFPSEWRGEGLFAYNRALTTAI
jgi:hypothetical protein